MENQNGKQKAWLLLSDGTMFEGKAIGSRGKAFGRAVFNTSMVGCQELLTDPANRGLLLTQTFPLVGNYGVNAEGWKSRKAQAAGYIVRELCELPSNFKCEGSLEDFLKEQGVVGICDIDTRRLTRHLRENGEMNGVIVSEGALDREGLLKELSAFDFAAKAKAHERLSGVAAMIPDTKQEHCIALINLGCDPAMLSALTRLGCKLLIVDSFVSPEKMKELAPDGIVISDGAGDPTSYVDTVEALRVICGFGIPILGVSLGHQLLALANGMKTRELKCGHRGANQPVLCLENGRTYITAQNHGFTVDESGMEESVCEVSYRNANDKTVEGLIYRELPAVSVQFLPDSGKGRQSTSFVYQQFMEMVKKGKVD